MPDLFIRNSWNLKYDTGFPDDECIGTFSTFGGAAALTPEAAVPIAGDTGLRVIVRGGDRYPVIPMTRKTGPRSSRCDSFSDLTVTLAGSNTVIAWAGNSLTLVGVTAITSDDVIFT